MASLVIHGLFQKRIDGDDALLWLARRRFDQAGMAAEVYASSPAELVWMLRFAPPEPEPPLVHLPRDLDLLDPRQRERVTAIARRAEGRVRGFVVHDNPAMPERLDELADAAASLSPMLVDTGSLLFLEYAFGATPAEFVAMARTIAPIAGVGMCVDSGHVGVRAARRAFAASRPDLDYDLAQLTPDDPRLPDVVDDVVAACTGTDRTVAALGEALAGLGGPLHFHLHDGHPLHHGLPDHRGFLTRIPVPFAHAGRYSLDPLFGPRGLGTLVASIRAARQQADVSVTLEIHQGEGRLAVPEAGEAFTHWRNLGNAERMNAWLAVLSENAQLVSATDT